MIIKVDYQCKVLCLPPHESKSNSMMLLTTKNMNIFWYARGIQNMFCILCTM